MSYWRDQARPIIARVLAATATASPEERKAALREAYPFGERRYHPYKIWLSEIAIQTGAKARRQGKRSGVCVCGHDARAHNIHHLGSRCHAADCPCERFDVMQATLALDAAGRGGTMTTKEAP